jgi:hypothetical protein
MDCPARISVVDGSETIGNNSKKASRMARPDQWFPAFENGKKSTLVVGRFVDGETVDVKASEVLKHNVYKSVPMLESKIVGSHDVSTQRVKEMNQDELTSRFPGAWEHYLEQKGSKPEPVISSSGVPIEELDFIPRQNCAWLRELGFTSAEQIRDMSDSVVQGLGRGAQTWRKKATEYLAHK